MAISLRGIGQPQLATRRQRSAATPRVAARSRYRWTPRHQCAPVASSPLTPRVDAARGRTIAVPMDSGELVSSSRLVGPDLLGLGDITGNGSGEPALVAAPVRLADAGQATLLRAGDIVDVIAARASDGGGQSANLVARDVRVITIAADAGSKGGLLPTDTAAGDPPDSSSLIVVAVMQDVATELAAAATRSRISVVLKPQVTRSQS